MNKALLGFTFVFTAVLALFVTSSTSSKETTVIQQVIKTPEVVFSAATTYPADKAKSIESLDLNQEQVLSILGPIDHNVLPIANKITELGRGKKPIYLLLDSPGGSVLDGGMVIAAMQASKVPVYTICMQLCASMAAMIHQYGTERYAIDRSILMFHPAAGGLQGTLEEMQSLLSTISRYVYKMDSHVAKRAGITPEKYHQMVVSQLWIDAEDALEQKFVDKIVSVHVPEKKPFSLPASENNQNKKLSTKDKFNFDWK